ncbi:MAG: organic hydroperoxide resistance protein [Burkholderiales bacterium PBB5]|nr:MAG: organic hydroperoxide resistance protein [Burkholderiales bacterium PBB5]
MELVCKPHMLTQGGRSGSIPTEGGRLKQKLAVPASMGGKGDGPNPEPRFAGAFAACFEQSVRHIVRKGHVPLKGCGVEAELSMYTTLDDAHRMALTLTVHMAGGLSQFDADNLVERAKGICPCVETTKNNVTLNRAAVLDTPVTA